MLQILPFDATHLALLETQPAQRGEAERFGQTVGRIAALGPAFSAVERDGDGHIVKVLACAGLVENVPVSDANGGYATAWASFGADLGARQMASITAAVRAVLDGCGYARVDMMVNRNFDAARRYAEALGFTLDSLIYARERNP